jgi:hypothetical protein
MPRNQPPPADNIAVAMKEYTTKQESERSDTKPKSTAACTSPYQHSYGDYGETDYWADLYQLHEDQLLTKMFNLFEKWGHKTKYWFIMLMGAAMLYMKPISVYLIKTARSQVTSIYSSEMNIESKAAMQRASALQNGNSRVGLEHLLPHVGPWLQCVEKYDDLLENGYVSLPNFEVRNRRYISHVSIRQLKNAGDFTSWILELLS